jgi:hypothetical protein
VENADLDSVGRARGNDQSAQGKSPDAEQFGEFRNHD